MQRFKPIKRTAVLALLLFTVYAANAQPAGSSPKVNQFSVKQAVDYAKQNSTYVKNALLDIKVQKEVNREYTSPAFPQINGSFVLNDYLDIPTSLIPAEFTGGTPGTYIPIKFGTKYNATGGIDVSQILFDGQVFVGLQARSTALKFSTKVADITVEEIAANVMKIYYQLVVGKKQLGTLQANIDRFEKLLNDTKETFNNGLTEKLNVDKVTVQLSNLRTEKVKTENMLKNGNSGLKFLMNMPQNETLVLTDSISEDEIKDNVLDTAYNYTDRKDYQLLELGKKLNQYNVKRYKLSYIPTVAAFGSYNKNAQRGKFDFFGDGAWFNTSLIGLRINVPIFDGFAKRSKLNRAKLEVERTNNNIEQLKNNIDKQVDSSRTNMASAVITMDSQKKNMQLAEEVYNTAKLKFDEGLGDNQEIYNAQAELTTAQNNYYSAVYDAIIAKIDYLKAIGKLQ